MFELFPSCLLLTVYGDLWFANFDWLMHSNCEKSILTVQFERVM